MENKERDMILDRVATTIVTSPWGIYDTKRGEFVKLLSGKFAWEKEGYAKNAFIHAMKSLSYKELGGKSYWYQDSNIDSQDRYVIKKFV